MPNFVDSVAEASRPPDTGDVRVRAGAGAAAAEAGAATGPQPAPAGRDDGACELTILMPCLNEARTIGTCIRKALAYLDAAGVDGEVVVADNGSTDMSREIAKMLGARVVPVGQRGYGAALIEGIRAARGRFVIMGDSDDSYDFLALSGFVQALRDGADLAMGNRFAGGIAPGAMPPLHRYLGNPVLSGIGRVLFDTPVRDFHCGLRGFRADRVRALDLSSTGMEFASEMVVKASLGGLRIVEVPTTLSRDGRDRPPHLRSWRDGWRHLRFLLAFSPRWSLMYPGIVLACAGWATLFALYGGMADFGAFALDIHTMAFAAGIALIGNQFCVAALLARCTGVRVGLLPDRGLARWALRHLRLEQAAAACGVLLLAGLGIALHAWSLWQGTGFSRLEPQQVMRPVLLSVTLAVSAVELLAGGLFMTLLQFAAQEHRR